MSVHHIIPKIGYIFLVGAGSLVPFVCKAPMTLSTQALSLVLILIAGIGLKLTTIHFEDDH